MRRISRRLIYVGGLLSIILLNIIMFCACAIFAHAVVTFVPWNEIRRVKHSRIWKTVTIHSPLLRDPYRIALELNMNDSYRSASELIKKSVGDRWRERLL